MGSLAWQQLGQFGFVLPDSEIRPVGIEQLAALVEFARGVLAKNERWAANH